MKTLITSLFVVFFMLKDTYSFNIDISSFSIVPNNEWIDLTWDCQVPERNCMFVLERADQSFVFSPLDTISVNDNRESYACSDNMPISGLSYYRLKCVTFDGRELSAKTGSIEFFPKPKNKSFEIVGLFPIPFCQNLNLSIKCKYDMRLTIGLRDQNGKLVYEITKDCSPGYANLNFSEIEHLRDDAYYLTVADENNNTETLYVVKTHNR